MRASKVIAVVAGVSLCGLPAAFAQQLPDGAAPQGPARVNLDPGLPPAQAAGAAPAQAAGPAAPVAAPASEGGIGAYFANWFNRVDQAQASQPHWIAPLATTTPRLEEEVRYDQFWEHLPNGGSLNSYDGGRGLELIPTTTNEVILGVPAYQERQVGRGRLVTGYGDYPAVLVKQRLFSENEQQGNAIVTAFLQVVAPTGATPYTGNAWIIAPTIAGGKGWGDFDIQATLGFNLPIGHFNDTGAQMLTNVTFQYELWKYFWPEFELNDTIWLGGSQRGGKDQLFLTPGIILGRFEIAGRVRTNFGVGYQFAVSPNVRTVGPLDPVYAHNWILSARVTF